MVREHGPEHPSQWAAITSIASKFGCTAETLRNWVRQAERDTGQRSGLTTDERQRLKELERDNRELKRAAGGPDIFRYMYVIIRMWQGECTATTLTPSWLRA